MGPPGHPGRRGRGCPRRPRRTGRRPPRRAGSRPPAPRTPASRRRGPTHHPMRTMPPGRR
ncbi:MAG: hypothetical protein FJ260_10620 [Planctomycetes bacterium]|nr:hypothetical protein [Planctomycetota bacterium]